MTSWSSRMLRAALLLVAGVAWVVVAHPFEGPVVLRFGASHGVHLNDWVALVAAWAAWLAVRPEPGSRHALVPVRVTRPRRPR